MKPDNLQRSIKVVGMMHALLEEIDYLSADGAIFKNTLKYKGKAFVGELETFISDLYNAIRKQPNSDEGEIAYQAQAKIIENLLKEYFSGNVTVQPDEMIDWIPLAKGSKYRISGTDEWRDGIFIDGRYYMPKIHSIKLPEIGKEKI